MQFSKPLSLLTCFLMLTTSVQAMDKPGGNSIPDDPDEELLRTPITLSMQDTYFQQGQQREQEGKYEEAAMAYKQAGVSGNSQAFLRLAYLYEEGKLGKIETVEERRLIDALAGFYIEKGVDQGGGFQLPGKASQFHGTATLEEGDGEVQTLTLAEILADTTLETPEKFIKIAQWYENHRRPDETIAQRRLRYAYAGRYYDEAALWHLSPAAYTALGNMYQFGKGIDISDEDMNLSAQMQAKEYYQGYQGTEADAEGQFMMGFLLEQEGTFSSDHEAEHYYQTAAAANYSPAAFRLGIRRENGQGDASDILSFYKQAEAYYTQALSSQQPSSFIADLIGMPKELATKVALVKKFQENLEELDAPVYGLLDVMFCDYLRTNIANILMPYWVELSLACYAHKHKLPFKKNPAETEKRIKDISTLLNGARPAQNIPDMSVYDQKLLNMQNGKNTFRNPAVQQMRMMQIRQYLSQEDDDRKWLDVPAPSTKNHINLWLERIQPLVTGLHELSQPFAGEPFLTTLVKRIQALPTADHMLNTSAALWPQAYVETLERDIALLKEEAQSIFKALSPHQRSLVQQILTYKQLQEIKKYTGFSLSPDILDNLLLAQKLMKDASQGKGSSDTLSKHFQSARALKAYALSKSLSIDDAKKDLKQKARNFFPLLSPEMHDFSLIGYDVLVKIIESGPSALWTDKSDHYRKQLLISLNQDDLDNTWIDDDQIRSYLSGTSDPASSALTKLYDQARAFVAANEEPFTNKPVLNLVALTYEDPHIGLYGNIVPDTFNDLQGEAKALYTSDTLGLSEHEIYGTLLDRDILEIRNIIFSLISKMPGISINDLDSITQTIEGSTHSPFQKIERKQNFLFVLRKSADWKNSNLEKITLATHEIIHGTEGRCPDGQADFCQKWILSYILNNLSQEIKDNPETALKLSLSLLLQSYKSTFIQKHASPFIRGSHEWTTNENRTAMPVLLTQALRLPLNIVGSYNAVSYPLYAIHSLNEPENVLCMQAIMERFLKGGEIIYQDLRVTKEEKTDSQGNKYQEDVCRDIDPDGAPIPYEAPIFFAPLTLKMIGQNLRYAFTDPTSNERKLSIPLPGLLPLPQLSFAFPDAVVESFLKYDPILASFYSTFMNSGYTKGNQFFDSQAAFAKGYHLQHILKDASILRILEIGGYAKVPQNFYQTLPENWKFE